MDKIIVLDFGSQYSHLICRRIRNFAVYAELVPYNIPFIKLKQMKPKGIILSGSPSSIYDDKHPIPEKHIFDSGIPILGICYGHQLIVNNFGGVVKDANKEYGSAMLSIKNNSGLLSNIGKNTRAWMSHGDEAIKIPHGFEITASTSRSHAAVIENTTKFIYGVQFHPEVVHTDHGIQILKNFVLKICLAKKEWNMKNFIDDTIKEISKITGDVICGVSGGIDSTVTALLIHKSIGNRLKCIFIDNGLLRIDEVKSVQEIFSKMGIQIITINAQKRFLDQLKNIYDPEKKRMVIGEEFVKIFSAYANKNKNLKWLAQGTLYPDVIESGISHGPSSVIKTHHNVGGIPNWLTLKILEPIRDLYKDDVRKIAKILNVPDNIINRHPFPGPGLAVRIIGEVTRKKLRIVRFASRIIEEELMKSKIYDTVWQAYAALGDDRATGVSGDKRKIGNIVMIRVVNSTDAMTADWTRLPYKILERISNRITNEIDEVTWVSYIISSKPPATIEPQ